MTSYIKVLYQNIGERYGLVIKMYEFYKYFVGMTQPVLSIIGRHSTSLFYANLCKQLYHLLNDRKYINNGICLKVFCIPQYAHEAHSVLLFPIGMKFFLFLQIKIQTKFSPSPRKTRKLFSSFILMRTPLL